MDPLTHAASGAVAMLALPKRPLTRWAWPLAALACASPDLDLLFARSPLDFLLLHRGISHAFVAAPFFGFFLALCCWPLWRKSTSGHWRFRAVWLFCSAMILLHIWLDVVTSYGTMVFLPFSHYRVRLNGIYIIDLLVTVPLLWAIWRWQAKRSLILLTLAWTFAYPALCVALNAWHEQTNQERLKAESGQVSQVHILPDAFAPFFWRVLYAEESQAQDNAAQVCAQSLNAIGQARAPKNCLPGAPKELVQQLKAQSTACEVFFDFAMLPVMTPLRPADKPEFSPQMANNLSKDILAQAEGKAAMPRLSLFYDLRFGSGLEWVRRLLAMRPNADIPFQLLSELAPEGAEAPRLNARLVQLRLRFSDSGRDSGWHKPDPPHPPDLAQWLVGLR